MKKVINIVTLFIITTFSLQGFISGIDENSKNQNIEIAGQALCIELLPCDTTKSIDEVHNIKKNAKEKYSQVDCGAALEIILDGMKVFSKDFNMQRLFASYLGDYAFLFSEKDAIKQHMINKSKEAFVKLMKELDNQVFADQSFANISSFKNEYYFRFEEHEHQYENGLQYIAHFWNTDEWKTTAANGYYYQGVGAAYHAKQLCKEGNIELAKIWAQRSVIAWAQHFSYENNHYNPYTHYALALGILGYYDEMMKALQRSADLAQKDLNYKEFTYVTDFIASIK